MSTEQQKSAPEQQSAPVGIIVFIIVLVILGAAYYMLYIDNPTSRPQPEIVDLKDEKLQPEPKIQELDEIEVEPVEEPSEPVSTPEPQAATETSESNVLPELDNSDELTVSLIREVTTTPELLDVLVPSDIIRRTVVFADNFSRGDIALRDAPVYPPEGKFQASQIKENEFVISPENYARYTGYIELLNSFEPEDLSTIYRQLLPLFEEAYQELGYPDRSFDDVTEDVFDRILAIEYPLESPVLKQPDVVYKFEDEALESLTDADKLLLRMGEENLLQLQSAVLQLKNSLNL